MEETGLAQLLRFHRPWLLHGILLVVREIPAVADSVTAVAGAHAIPAPVSCNPDQWHTSGEAQDYRVYPPWELKLFLFCVFHLAGPRASVNAAVSRSA